MILIVLSAMIGASKLLMPYSEQISRNSADKYQKLFQYILANSGAPSNWGNNGETVPTSFGLAKSNSTTPYELDIDKISKLNNQNAYALTYRQIVESLGMQDVTLRLEVTTFFNVTATLTNTSSNGTQTAYTFEVVAKKSESPVQASLHCYTFVDNYVQNVSTSTSSSGTATVSVSISNSMNGTALFIVLAKMYPQIFAFDVYRFVHFAGSTAPDGSFLRASPLNHTAHINLLYAEETVSSTRIFSYNLNFSMAEMSSENQTAEYSIPHLLDGPMILVFAGTNGSAEFAEWVSYPQLPFEMGIDFDDLDLKSNIVSITSVCTINFALYQITAKFGGPR
jgi:hypothetical protein